MHTITVNGTGSIIAKPDTASIILGVRTHAKTVNEALASNNKYAQNILKGLYDIGISKNDIETSSFSIYPQYNYDPTPTLSQYEVEHLFHITLHDTNKVPEIYSISTDHGANVAQALRFSLKNAETYYEQALTKALHQCHQKAMALAKSLNVYLSPIPYNVKELSTIQSTPVSSKMVLAQSAPPIQSQDILIEASVQCMFSYSTIH